MRIKAIDPKLLNSLQYHDLLYDNLQKYDPMISTPPMSFLRSFLDSFQAKAFIVRPIQLCAEGRSLIPLRRGGNFSGIFHQLVAIKVEVPQVYQIAWIETSHKRHEFYWIVEGTWALQKSWV